MTEPTDYISRADAIEAVGEWMQKEYGYLDLNRAERLIDALSALPSADTVPQGRLIDADSLISDLEEWKENPNNDDSAVDLVNHFIGIIKATPSADAEQGEWVYIDNYFRVATCSRCHKVTMFEKWGAHTKPFNYCPKCGAKMSGYVFNDDFVESEDKK